MKSDVKADLETYEQVLDRYEKKKLGRTYAEQLKAL